MEIEQIERIIKSKSDDLIEAIKNNAPQVHIESLEEHLSKLKLTRKKMEMSVGKPKLSIKELIKRLTDLDMSKYPDEEVKNLFGEMGQIPIMSKFLYPNRDSFIRARAYKKGEPSFNLPAQLNYNPKPGTSFQRATIKDQTAFYGCLKKFDGEDIVSKDGKQEIDNRFVACMEAYRALENHDLCEIRRIGFGRWDVTQRIQVISILHEDMLKSPISALRNMYQDFLNWAKEFDIEEEAVLIANFLAEKFSDANAGIGKEYLYIISAVFSNLCYHQPSIDGVMYPSVRTEKDGICVALSTDAANAKMKLTAAGEGIIYKNKKQTIINNDTFCYVPDGATSFSMTRLTDYVATEDQIKEIIQISSFDELEDNR